MFKVKHSLWNLGKIDGKWGYGGKGALQNVPKKTHRKKEYYGLLYEWYVVLPQVHHHQAAQETGEQSCSPHHWSGNTYKHTGLNKGLV